MGVCVCVWACSGVVRTGAKALGVVGVEAMAGGDADDGGGDDARMGFKRTSNCCNWFATVWNLACQSGGVVDRGVFFFDFLPHEFARRERGLEVGLGWGRREAVVPVSA